jgi:hypothetical protein
VDLLNFIANVVGSLAWPVTVGGIVCVLWRNRRDLARFVKTIKYKDVELTLRDDFEKATDLADGIRATLPALQQEAAALPAPDIDDRLMKIARLDPTLAVLSSWQKLEAKIIQLIQHNGLMRFVSPPSFMRRLRELEKLTPQDIELYDRLRSIRNEAVHATQSKNRGLSLGEVAEYDKLIDTLVERLEQIRNEPGYVGIDFEAYDARQKAKGLPVGDGPPSAG